ncbi:MAG: hypothetical protein Q9216_006123 [Gyalolechia sp. 2 TL-2023]
MITLVSADWLTLVTDIGSLSLVYCFLLVVYRLYFHPLAQFPGPKIAAATKWYECYMDIIKGQGGQFKWEIDRMHSEFGPVVRINPDEIHVDDPSWFQVLHAGPTTRDRYPPAAKMLGITSAAFSTIPHDLHRMRRSAINSYFSKSSIEDLEAYIHQRVELLCDRLRSSLHKGPVDVHAIFLAYSNDSVCEYSFDYSMNLLEDSGRALDWKMTIDAIASLTPLIKQFPWIIPLVRKIPLLLLRAVSPKLTRILSLQAEMDLEASQAIQRIRRSNVTERPQTQEGKLEGNKPRLFQQILESNLPAHEKTSSRMGQEGFSVIAAGGETVARTLTVLTYHLLANPDLLLKLRQELKCAQPDLLTPLSFHELERLPWLTPVGMTMMNVLHNPEIYPSPHTFDPSRWLNLGPNASQNQHFICYVAAVFRRFELELYDTERMRDVESTRDCFIGEIRKGSRGVRVRVLGERVE